ncbi:hypothetical protein QBC39DRAFT_325897 [Podospora conica]|nr:hypothetical protein QBC39DRAFT_325897 [Schizothecium conicum]
MALVVVDRGMSSPFLGRGRTRGWERKIDDGKGGGGREELTSSLSMNLDYLKDPEASKYMASNPFKGAVKDITAKRQPAQDRHSPMGRLEIYESVVRQALAATAPWSHMACCCPPVSHHKRYRDTSIKHGSIADDWLMRKWVCGSQQASERNHRKANRWVLCLRRSVDQRPALELDCRQIVGVKRRRTEEEGSKEEEALTRRQDEEAKGFAGSEMVAAEESGQVKMPGRRHWIKPDGSEEYPPARLPSEQERYLFLRRLDEKQS